MKKRKDSLRTKEDEVKHEEIIDKILDFVQKLEEVYSCEIIFNVEEINFKKKHT